ncbi:uncharacterized protein KY384_007398 [Bacidia gigantensis]|uniref:uncharacterized protein n=1 Tax=Bacidia gigantensis TaxID=2732470 RepID=UPI001D055A5E|nr:uncharacterized protein KY384_007398 [Bacidia gigantensis]KAG8528480.1 hypothetical protein KY384_007398 [Bacidia gigantensis]
MLAQPVPREERPAPILLGTESRREYFLAPAPLTIDAVTRKELCDNREWQHEYIYRIRSVDEEAPAPFEYGYCLGTLQVGVPHPYSEMPEGSRLSCVTHFEVWLEVGSEGKRKGVWLVRNGNRGSFNFPFDPLLPWRSVGGPENGMPEFQVLRILEHVSELRNTDRRTGGSFFDGLRDTKLFSTGPVNEALLKPLHDDSDPALLVERIDI